MSTFKPLVAACVALFVHYVQTADVQYTMDLTWDIGAPDGNPRKMVLNNGGFPGPELRLDEGDNVKITVNNKMPFNTTIHWHGLAQLGTPWSDGVPGLSQKPIEPGASFVYQFTAEPYGSYWYHSHSRGILQDGLYGAILIRPKPGTPDPFYFITNDTDELTQMQNAQANPNIVLLSDWDHLTSWDYQVAETDSGADLFCVDSILINGKGAVNCQTPEMLASLVPPPLEMVLNGTALTDRGCLPESVNTQGNYSHNYTNIPASMSNGCKPTTGSMEIIEVDAANGWASLNFISGASLKALVVSIDEHPIYLYALDGEYVEPQLAQSFYIFNGARSTVMVKLDKTPGDYTIRVADQGGDQLITGYATLSYKGGKDLGPSKSYIDYAGTNTSADVVNLGLTYTPPFIREPPALIADATHHLRLGRLGSSWQWTLNGNALYPMDADAYTPLLFNDNTLDAMNPNLTIRTTNGSWVDIILHVELNAANPIQPPHVIHKHSNKGYFIGQGMGRFTWDTVAEAQKDLPEQFNLEKAGFRDTFVTSPQGESWLAIRYQVVNPGAFMLHCHIETHLEGGMAIAILDGVDAWPTVPDEYLT